MWRQLNRILDLLRCFPLWSSVLFAALGARSGNNSNSSIGNLSCSSDSERALALRQRAGCASSARGVAPPRMAPLCPARVKHARGMVATVVDDGVVQVHALTARVCKLALARARACAHTFAFAFTLTFTRSRPHCYLQLSAHAQSHPRPQKYSHEAHARPHPHASKGFRDHNDGRSLGLAVSGNDTSSAALCTSCWTVSMCRPLICNAQFLAPVETVCINGLCFFDFCSNGLQCLRSGLLFGRWSEMFLRRVRKVCNEA